MILIKWIDKICLISRKDAKAQRFAKAAKAQGRFGKEIYFERKSKNQKIKISLDNKQKSKYRLTTGKNQNNS